MKVKDQRKRQLLYLKSAKKTNEDAVAVSFNMNKKFFLVSYKQTGFKPQYNFILQFTVKTDRFSKLLLFF